ncbi:MAG: DUF3089 domain-containing protein [Bacillota bacterium]
MHTTDYYQKNNWLKLDEQAKYPFDIFYLYATAYVKTHKKDPIICDINHRNMRSTAKFNYHKNATAFRVAGNMFAPYYRQTDALSCLPLPLEEKKKILRIGPVTDAIAAFNHFIKYYNQGRPYILAAHSQGSDVLLQLLSEYMKENPQIYKRMVAAYAIGYSVTKEYLSENPHLKFAQGREDTGVIISYNTEAPSIEGKNPVLLPNTLAINPINWQRNETLAPKEESLGARVKINNSFKKIAHLADAKINMQRGTVICSSIDRDNPFCDVNIFPQGVYHVADYALYYYDIRQNALDRIAAYLKTHS